MSAEQSKLSFEPRSRLTRVSRTGSPSLLSTRSPALPAGPLRGSRRGAFKDAPPARGPLDGRERGQGSELSRSSRQRQSFRAASEGARCRELRSLLQKPGESWTIWDTRDLRSYQSAVLEDALPVTERLADKTRAGSGQAGRLAPRPAG